MKLASIMPANFPELVPSTYHFCFAELALRFPAYAEFYRKAPGIVIMDTMVFEKKGPLPLRLWLEALDLVRPTVAVCPDVLANTAATKANYRFYRQFTTSTLMPVAQGSTFKELIECFEYFITRSDWIALPVQVRERRHERFELLRQISKLDLPENLKIHLLGASSDTFEREQEVRDLPCVVGVDTTKPIAAALNGYALPSDAAGLSDRPEGFFELPKSTGIGTRDLILQNVNYVRSLICSTTA